MKFRFAALVVLFLIPIAGYSHGELFFPKVFSPAELSTAGFVFMNPNSATVNLNIYFVNAAGGGYLSQTKVSIPPGGQLAKLGSELFPNVSLSGWVWEQNDNFLEVQGFWLNYNSDITSMDGSSAAADETLGMDQIVPLVAGQTELNVINTNLGPVTTTIRLFGSNGQLGQAVTRTFSIVGALRSQVADLFPSVDIEQARYIRVTSTLPTISAVVIRNYLVPVDSLVLNGVNVSATAELTFPHVINGSLGSANYTTVLGVTNVSTSSQTITIVFNSDSHAPVSVTRTIASGDSLRDSAKNLLGLSDIFESGWVSVSGTAGLAGFAAYADTVGGGLSAVPATTAQTRLFFSHIAEGPPQWQTGLALLNATNAPAIVDVYAVNASATLIGGPLNVSSARLSVNPGQRVVKVIHDLIPQTAGVNSGFVFISSDAKIHGIELFYTQDLKVLANVAPGTALGAAYTPPLP